MNGPSCLETHEQIDVIATCLLAQGHPGPHCDYGNSVRWLNVDGLTDDDALAVYCMACSAAPGTPCSNPMLGDVTAPHAARFGLALR